jgi:integrase
VTRSLVVDRQFRGVGRIKRATGTDDPKLLRLLDSMLDTLYRAGRVDVLRLIQSGHLHPLAVWSQYRLGDLNQLPSALTMRPLKEAMEAWLENADTGDWNRASRRYAVRALLKLAKKNAAIEDLPDLLRALSNTTQRAAMFNRTRAAVQAFVRDTIGKSQPLYGRIRDIRVKQERPRMGNPQSPDQLRELAEKLEPSFASIMWSMALTGMGPGELWGKWTQHPTHIHVHGTKRKGRVRDIPRIYPIAAPTRLYRAFFDALAAASGGTVKPYDLRRTYANWMEAAEISRVRRKIYLGHSVGDVTDLYERHELEKFWQEDAERMRRYMGTPIPPVGTLRLA